MDYLKGGKKICLYGNEFLKAMVGGECFFGFGGLIKGLIGWLSANPLKIVELIFDWCKRYSCGLNYPFFD